MSLTTTPSRFPLDLTLNGSPIRVTRAGTDALVYHPLALNDATPPVIVRSGPDIPAAPMVITDETTDAEIIAHLANPPAPPAPVLRQTTRVVIDRLTFDEKTALRACTIPQIIDAYDVAVSEGAISEADPQFEEFTDALHTLGIILKPRWQELLAP